MAINLTYVLPLALGGLSGFWVQKCLPDLKVTTKIAWVAVLYLIMRIDGAWGAVGSIRFILLLLGAAFVVITSLHAEP